MKCILQKIRIVFEKTIGAIILCNLSAAGCVYKYVQLVLLIFKDMKHRRIGLEVLSQNLLSEERNNENVIPDESNFDF